MSKLEDVAEIRFRGFLRDAGLKGEDDQQLRKAYYAGFLLGAVEGSNVNGSREEFQLKLGRFNRFVQNMLQE